MSFDLFVLEGSCWCTLFTLVWAREIISSVWSRCHGMGTWTFLWKILASLWQRGKFLLIRVEFFNHGQYFLIKCLKKSTMVLSSNFCAHTGSIFNKFCYFDLMNCYFRIVGSSRVPQMQFFSSPCQRQCDLLPSLGVRRPSSVIR